eukprot:2464718-Karenia_brevis.AAC.1
MSWMWDVQVGAIQKPCIQCWICGQMGHLGRNCSSKGKGKGVPPVGKGASIPLYPFGAKGNWGPSPRSRWSSREGSPWSKWGRIPQF